MKDITIMKVLLNSLFIICLVSIAGCVESSDSSTSETTTTSATTTDSDFAATDWTEATHSKNADPDFDEVFDDSQVKRFDIVVTETEWQSMLDNMTDLYGEFGSTSNSNTQIGGTPADGTIPEDGTIAGPPADGTIPEDGTIAGPATDDTALATADVEDPDFVAADVYYNGTQWYEVGVRFKGNSSLQSAWEAGILKLSFKLDFDEYEDDYEQIKNQRFYGFKKLSLKNNYNDSSFLREKVAADVFKDAGMAISHTAFYEVYVDHGDGPEYFGLYTLVEEVDDTVIDEQFSSDDENLYKPDGDSASFKAGTFSADDFVKKTNDDEDEADWSDIEALFTALHDSSRTTDALSWRTNLETLFDVDTFIKYMAVNGVIQNWDTYGRMTHNYFLYANPDNDQKLTWIPWDNNEALEEGKLGGALDLDFSNLDTDEWPLMEKIYADETYKAQYDLYLQNTIDTYFNVDTMQAKYTTYSALVEASATSEVPGYTFLNSVNDFSTAISTLKTHVSDRTTAVETYLAQ